MGRHAVTFGSYRGDDEQTVLFDSREDAEKFVRAAICEELADELEDLDLDDDTPIDALMSTYEEQTGDTYKINPLRGE